MLKQVIIIPAYLKMSPGKVASQCCHVVKRPVGKRVILKAQSPQQLNELWWWAGPNFYGLARVRYVDAAPTTRGAAGFVTAISFVGPEKWVDAVTAHLELL